MTYSWSRVFDFLCSGFGLLHFGSCGGTTDLDELVEEQFHPGVLSTLILDVGVESAGLLCDLREGHDADQGFTQGLVLLHVRSVETGSLLRHLKGLEKSSEV